MPYDEFHRYITVGEQRRQAAEKAKRDAQTRTRRLAEPSNPKLFPEAASGLPSYVFTVCIPFAPIEVVDLGNVSEAEAIAAYLRRKGGDHAGVSPLYRMIPEVVRG